MALSCFAFVMGSGALNAADGNNEPPSIVEKCKDLNQTEIDDYTKRFYDLSKNKRALLNGLMLKSFINDNFPYNRVHLEIMYKSVEVYNEETVRTYLNILYSSSKKQ